MALKSEGRRIVKEGAFSTLPRTHWQDTFHSQWLLRFYRGWGPETSEHSKARIHKQRGCCAAPSVRRSNTLLQTVQFWNNGRLIPPPHQGLHISDKSPQESWTITNISSHQLASFNACKGTFILDKQRKYLIQWSIMKVCSGTWLTMEWKIWIQYIVTSGSSGMLLPNESLLDNKAGEMVYSFNTGAAESMPSSLHIRVAAVQMGDWGSWNRPPCESCRSNRSFCKQTLLCTKLTTALCAVSLPRLLLNIWDISMNHSCERGVLWLDPSVNIIGLQFKVHRATIVDRKTFNQAD